MRTELGHHTTQSLATVVGAVESAVTESQQAAVTTVSRVTLAELAPDS